MGVVRMDRKYQNIAGIYTIFNKKTKYLYVGRTHSLFDRITMHESRLRNNKHYNRMMQYDTNKYGLESFEFKILTTLYFPTSDKRITTLLLDAREKIELARVLSENPSAKLYNKLDHHFDKRKENILKELYPSKYPTFTQIEVKKELSRVHIT